MSRTEDYLDRVCAQIRNDALHAEIRAELRAHLEETIAELERDGVAPADAVAGAFERLGDPAVVGKGLHKAHKPRLNLNLLGSTLLLVGMGLFSLAMAAYNLPPNTYLNQQILWIIMGMTCLAALYFVDYRRLAGWGWPLYYLTLGAVLLNLFFSQHGRYYRLDGFLMESAKIMFILSFAGTLAKQKKSPQLGSILFYGAIPALALWGNNKPAALLLALVFFAMLWRVGLKGKRLLKMMAGFVSVCLVCLLKAPAYQLARLLVFLAPGRDSLGAGYIIVQSKKAIVSAGLWGKGLFTYNNLLPEQHTNFIYSSLVQQAGWAVGLVVLVVFIALLYNIFRLLPGIKDDFPALVTFGTGTMLALNIFGSVGMQVGLLPTMGIGLPFFSYGGSAVIANFVALGLVLNAAKENKNWVMQR